MSLYLELSIQGKVEPNIAQALICMIEDWTMIRNLKTPFTDLCLKKAHKLLENLFMSSDTLEETVEGLKRGQFSLHSEYKIHDEFTFLLEDFLPHILSSLEEGWFIYEEESQRTFLTFDPKSKTLTQHAAKEEPWTQQKEGLAAEKQDRAWEQEYGSIDIVKWRKGLARLILFIGDLEQQQKNFVERKVSNYMPATSWDDLSDIYFSVLNLEDGFSYALKKKFLSKGEVTQLEKFDKMLRSYVAPDGKGGKTAALLRDPEWISISDEARALCKTLVLALD